MENQPNLLRKQRQRQHTTGQSREQCSAIQIHHAHAEYILPYKNETADLLKIFARAVPAVHRLCLHPINIATRIALVNDVAAAASAVA